MAGRATVVIGVAALLAAILVVPVGTQQTPPQPPRAGSVSDGVTAVLVDVVVRDKRGAPIRDLDVSEFEIYEDGTLQQIGSFTPVFERQPNEPSKPPAPPSAATVPTVEAGPGVTALLFDRLSPEGRRTAALAARNYLGSKEESPDFVAVYGVDLALTPYVPFTRNAVALRKALDAVVNSSSGNFTSPAQREAIAEATAQANAAARNEAAATAGATGPGAAAIVGPAAAAAQLTAMQAGMLRDFENMEHDQQGYATTNALFAIINTLGRIPGRKSIVLFSEGMSIPPAVHRLFLGVIAAANRANVSIYAMDAAGLRAESEQAKIRDMVNLRGSVGINTGYASEGTAAAAYTSALEGNEGTLRSDPAYGLNELSNSTGGLFFNNTNNLRPAFERIETDIRNYYLIGYTPSNSKYDGRFRTIEVRLKRPSVVVAARKGYFAVRDPGGAAVNSWEAPVLGALEEKPLGNAFPIRAGALLFPDRGRPGLVPVVVSLKTAPLTFQTAADGKSYGSDFTVLVRFVDSQNLIARKVSQHYEIRGPAAEIERAKQGDVLFYRESELPAGVYTMEAIVYDAPTGKSSVRIATVEVPKYDENTLRVSSLVIVKRSEKLAEKDRRKDHPLLVGDALLHPNVGEPVSRAAKELGFYFVAYPAKRGPAAESVIELMLNGKLVAQVPMPLPAPDASGRIQQVGRLPLDQIAPGTYQLRAVVKQGTAQVANSAVVRIEP
jgi:VWFA-related protein